MIPAQKALARTEVRVQVNLAVIHVPVQANLQELIVSSKCAQDGGTLAQADSEAVNNYLDTLRGNGDTAWIGLNDLETENTFKWDGSQQPVSFTNWNTNEPNNGAGTGEEDCVEMSATKKWNDYYCASLNFYFCQRSSTIAP
ncbi:collectin-10-like [Ruditapes philippinarum]|uniref:collectin-10-like n=1 Tax=Ruditapes philippinarum TaxID=129788 RepID=UPI00295AFC9A|nr:collectin-10-like [Ruditapes philippinarum]